MRKDIEEALYTYLARKWGWQDPIGKVDKYGRWYPKRREKQRCCQFIKPPTSSQPETIKAHCYTIEHVARLHKVDVNILGAAALQEGSEDVLRREHS